MDSSRKNNSRNEERRRKRRNAFYLASISWIILAVALCAGFYYGIRLQAININSIRVEGAKDVSNDLIRDTAKSFLVGNKHYVIPNSSILFYPRAEIADKIKSLDAKIKSIDVHFNNLNSITIAVEERVADALWCGEKFEINSQCFFMDNEAVIYGEAPNLISGQLFRYFGTTTREVSTTTVPISFMDKSEYSEISNLFSKYASLGLPIIGYERGDDTSVLKIWVEPKWNILLTKGDLYDTALSRVLKLLNDTTFQIKTRNSTSSIEYIDARISSKLFFKIDSTGVATSTEYKIGSTTASTTRSR